MDAMRDPAGIPAPPFVFQALMVITWALHIAFVHLSMGAAGLAIYAFHSRSRGAHWTRLSMAMTKVAKVGVSLLIVLGVAPLLFTQVIYDPQWYTSNVLSGRWALAFIFTLLVAYCSWYVFYVSNHEHAKRRAGCYAWIALLLFCVDGLIMHALSYQALLPEKWMSWYAPGGVVDTRGAALHAIEWARYVLIMGLSVPAIGVFLIAYAHYFSVRGDRDARYLVFARELGRQIAQWGFLFSIVPMLAWQFDLPPASGLELLPLGWSIVGALAIMGAWMRLPGSSVQGYLPMVANFGIVSLLAVWREVIRMRYLKPLGYDIHSYTVHPDAPSMLLFFLTLAGIGGVVGGFYLTLLYRSGRVAGRYTAEPLVRYLARGALSVLGVWITAFLAYGVVISLRDSFN
ncbi:conserved membrane hypothetical protein [Paraburkholderia tropica]|nr:conserved membrane hypothetical protein [Paraburkholderia tropica]